MFSRAGTPSALSTTKLEYIRTNKQDYSWLESRNATTLTDYSWQDCSHCRSPGTGIFQLCTPAGSSIPGPDDPCELPSSRKTRGQDISQVEQSRVTGPFGTSADRMLFRTACHSSSTCFMMSRSYQRCTEMSWSKSSLIATRYMKSSTTATGQNNRRAL